MEKFKYQFRHLFGIILERIIMDNHHFEFLQCAILGNQNGVNKAMMFM